MKRYAMEASFLSRLLSDRRDLLAAARALHTAEAMREARADLIAAARINLTPKTIEESSKTYSVDADGAAHIAIVGELTPSARTDSCGAYTAEALTEYGFIEAALAAAEADPKVSAIALDINSPGGYVDGVDRVAQAIAASSKPVTAYIDSMAASAAYWIASQADRIVALSPASEVGSIGVAAEEYDDRDALAAEGIAHRIYTSTDAPDKVPDTATEEGRAKVVAELDALHAVFVRRVSEGRHVTPSKVSKDFGHGGVLTSEAALAVGMIDEVRGSHLARKVSPAGPASSAAAATAADISPKEVRMDSLTLSQLKAEHPDAYAQAFEEGKAAGVAEGTTSERKRREALLKFKSQNAAVDQAVEKAVAEGKTYEEALPEITAAAVFSGAGENAPAIGSKVPDSGSGTNPMSAEDQAWYAKHGASPEDIKKIADQSAKEE